MLDSISFFRVIKTGLTNFVRNLWLSMAATMVMTITLVIFSTLFLLFVVTNYSIHTIQNTVKVSVYFKVGLTQEQIFKIQSDIQANPKVAEVDYISADQALADFKLLHADKPAIIASLNELDSNPLSAALHIKTYKLADFPEVSQNLQSGQYSDFIDSINYDDNRVIIDRLDKILRFIITFGIGLVVVFALIAILVIFNTITLTIYNRKEEVEIMRLVGATNWYIRGPFLTESIMYSIFSTLLTLALFIPVITKVLPKVTGFVNPAANSFQTNLFNYWYMALILFALALFLSTTSTFLAIRKYLRI